MVLQYFDIWILFKNMSETHYSVCGFLGNSNLAGAFLALTLPCFFRNKWKYGLFVIFPCLFLSKSLGGVLSGSIGSLFYISMLNHRFKYVFLSFIVALSLFYVIKIDPIKIINQ